MTEGHRFHPSPRRPARAELAFLALWAVAFLAVNVSTAELFPVVWLDEVMYIDPAVNLYLGHGFHSTAWPAQPRTETWISNSPLYQGLLFLWMRLWGFGPTAVRSLDHLLAALLIAALWLAALRSGLLSRPRSRILLVLMLSCGFGFTFIYRSGRPDCVTMMPVVLAFLASTLSGGRRRWMAAFACGLLVAVSGLAAIPFLGILGALLLLFLGLRILPLVASTMAGVVVGGAGFLAALEGLGLRQTFLRAALSHSSVPRSSGIEALFAGIAARLGENPHAVFHDWSVNFLGMAIVTLLAGDLVRRRLDVRSPLAFALLALVWIPTGMAAAGKYPLYYSWMAYVPVVLAFLRHGEQDGRRPVLRGVRRLAVLLALAVGLPWQLTVALYDREARDYAQVERLVAESVAQGDWVYCDYAAYYPAKKRAAEVFLPTYNRHFLAGELAEIDAVILRDPEPAVWWMLIHPELEDHWQPTGRRVACARRGLRLLAPHWPYVDYRSLRVYARVERAGSERRRTVTGDQEIEEETDRVVELSLGVNGEQPEAQSEQTAAH